MSQLASKIFKAPLLTGLTVLSFATLFSGCYSSVDLRPGYSTSNCYWRQTYDQYGAYEQQYCWNPTMRGYNPYFYNGSYVRRYPSSYPVQYRSPTVVVDPSYGYGGNYRPGYSQNPGYGYAPPVVANPAYNQPTPVYAPPAVVTPPARPVYNDPVYIPPRAAPPAVVTPPAAYPAGPGRRPVVPGFPKPDAYRKAVTVELPSSAVGRLDLQGDVFRNADVAVHTAPQLNKVVVEAVISGPSESEVNRTINGILRSRKIENGSVAVGEGVNSNCRVDSVDIVTPEGAPVSVRN